MKKIKYVIFGLLLSTLGVGVIHAASLSVSANKSTVVVGSTVTVTVNASGASGWEYCLNYDTSIFSLTSASSDTGGKCVRAGATLIGYSKVTFTLKAIKSGSSTISLTDAMMYGEDGAPISSSKNSLNLITKTQAEIEASYSTNANLKSLEVEDFSLTPEFHKDTLAYTLEVENDVLSVVVNAAKEDRAANVRGAGEIELSEGVNKVEIVVTAEKGNKKTYVITITRKELNPIFVQVNGENYTIVRKSDALEAPLYYTSTTTLIDDTEVPAFINDITGFTLVGLKNDNGDIFLYRIDAGTYILYKQVNMEGIVFIPLDATSLLSDYSLVKTLQINGENVSAYYKEGMDENFVLVYGMNAKTGKNDWYQYDLVEGTLQRFENKEVDKLKDNLKKYFLLIIVFASGLGLSVFFLLVLLIHNIKIRNKNKKMASLLENGSCVKTENDIQGKASLPVKEKKSEDSSIDNEDDSLQEEKIKEKKKKVSKKKEVSNEKKSKELLKENKEMVEIEEPKEEVLSKRELRKLEKMKESERQEELKAIQNDFFSEEFSRKSLIEVLEEEKKKKNK